MVEFDSSRASEAALGQEVAWRREAIAARRAWHGTPGKPKPQDDPARPVNARRYHRAETKTKVASAVNFAAMAGVLDDELRRELIAFIESATAGS